MGHEHEQSGGSAACGAVCADVCGQVGGGQGENRRYPKCAREPTGRLSMEWCGLVARDRLYCETLLRVIHTYLWRSVTSPRQEQIKAFTRKFTGSRSNAVRSL